MNTNVGLIDRIIRLVLGLVLLFSPLLNVPAIWASQPLAYISMAVGLVLLGTGLFGHCLLYRVFGITTNNS
ncbi:MAG: DUF2892 domain-containing protein [Pseudomonadota bacterium]